MAHENLSDDVDELKGVARMLERRKGEAERRVAFLDEELRRVKAKIGRLLDDPARMG